MAVWAWVADHAQAADSPRTPSLPGKDLQWRPGVILLKARIRGLRDGLTLCQGLLDRFWDTLYPEADEGEFDDRVAPIEWITSKLLTAIKAVPLCREGYNFFAYKESRTVEYEELTKTKDQKAAREKALKDGKLAPELFDKAFSETPKSFYADLEKQFDSSFEALDSLDAICSERFGAHSAPSFTKLKETLQEVRHVVHQLLQKKREIEPDPVEPVPPPVVAAAQQEPVLQSGSAPALRHGRRTRT